MEDNSKEEASAPTPESPQTAKILLKGWTREEKFTLLTSLKTYGSHKIKEIAKEIPSKTENEIKSAIKFYKKKVIQTKMADTLPKCETRARKLQNKEPRIPLAQWAKLLTDSLPYKSLQTETKDAIRLIADFENFPPPRDTEQIDFQKVYHLLADAMEGKSLPDDRLLTELLNVCLIDTVLHSKAFIKPSSLKFVINNINLDNTDLIRFNRPTKDGELATFRYLTSQKNYNPLNIPEEFQTLSTYELGLI